MSTTKQTPEQIKYKQKIRQRLYRERKRLESSTYDADRAKIEREKHYAKNPNVKKRMSKNRDPSETENKDNMKMKELMKQEREKRKKKREEKEKKEDKVDNRMTLEEYLAMDKDIIKQLLEEKKIKKKPPIKVKVTKKKGTGVKVLVGIPVKKEKIECSKCNNMYAPSYIKRHQRKCDK